MLQHSPPKLSKDVKITPYSSCIVYPYINIFPFVDKKNRIPVGFFDNYFVYCALRRLKRRLRHLNSHKNYNLTHLYYGASNPTISLNIPQVCDTIELKKFLACNSKHTYERCPYELEHGEFGRGKCKVCGYTKDSVFPCDFDYLSKQFPYLSTLHS
jgi:hypothetical protein